MLINAYDTMPPLGWLPLTSLAQQDGFLPVYRRLRQDHREIIDEWGCLSPDLYWRYGRGRGAPDVEAALALELVRSSAQAAALDKSHPNGSLGLRTRYPALFAEKIPPMNAVADAWLSRSRSAICLSSPSIPHTLSRSAWLKALPRLVPAASLARLGMLMRDPGRIARLGFEMLCAEWAAHGQARPQTAEALAIVGLGFLGLFPRVRCAVCYRLAIPSSTRCRQHSQNQYIRGEADEMRMHSQISSQARLARSVIAELNWSRSDFLTDRGEDCYVEEKTIAGLFWGASTGYCGYTIQHLKDGFRAGRFPRVRSLLPHNFLEGDDVRACAALRQHIDPGEWAPSYWHSRVVAAELWLEAATSLSPGRAHMKPSTLNLERVARARFLLQQGHSNKSIAAQLGISPSHLSHLLRRLGDV